MPTPSLQSSKRSASIGRRPWGCVALWMVAYALPNPGAAISFVAPANQPQVGIQPTSIATADFNGDGVIDLAVTNFDETPEAPAPGTTISILLGNGNGTFAPQTLFTTGAGPRYVVAARLNADSHIDLAIANYWGDSVTILLGQGDGTFVGGNALAAGDAPFTMDVALLNGDAHRDLAVTNSGDGTISIFLGNGDGTFAAPTSIAAGGTTPTAITIADTNGDLAMDLVYTTGFDLQQRLGAGNGTFAAPVSLGALNGSEGITTGSFNADSIPDVAATSTGTSMAYVYVGNGNGTFSAPSSTSTGSSPYSIVAQDFNGDEKLDWAAVNYNSSNVSVGRGIGDGTFMAAVNVAAGTLPRTIASADFNADGKPDLAIGNMSSTLRILLNTTLYPYELFANGFE